MLPKIIQHILVTVDNVIFTTVNDQLQVLLVKRGIAPFKDSRALPWGFVKEHETLEDAAHRDLANKTNVKNIYLEQLYTFSDLHRDPRGRVISAAYMSLIAREHILIKPGDYVTEAKFFSIKSLPKLAFDHKIIIQYAMQRLRWKFEYSNVAQYILPKKFTLSELQKVYEMVLEQHIDVRNFRKKIDKLGIIRPTGEKEIGVKYRPAQLFEFVDKKFKIVEMI